MPDGFFEIGTLIKDKGKIGIIYRHLDAGDLDTSYNSIRWQRNYEIYFLDGNITILGERALSRLIKHGQVEIIENVNNLSNIKEY
jgi:hypothetical protein